LKAIKAYRDVERARDSRKLRAGVGKSRNRRYVQRRGPLVVYNEDKGITQAFRNLPGVELCQVDRLNLLQLAPGGHVGRFVVWTAAALRRLESNWGTVSRESSQKSGYTLPRPIMLQSDLSRLINSDEIQSKVRPAIKQIKRARTKKNPLTNLGAMVTLNPYALALRRSEILTSTRRAAARKAAVEAKRKGGKPVLSKNDVQAVAAEKKADKKHKSVKSKNYVRLSGVGNADKKPVVIEEPIQMPKVIIPKGKAATAAAGTKPATATTGTAAVTAAPKTEAAKPADAKPADKKEDKKADKKDGDKKADKKGDKKDGDKKGDKKDGDKKKEGGDKKGGDKKGGDKKEGGDKKGGDKKGGDKKGGDKKKEDKK